MENNGNEKSQKIAKEFLCKQCDYKCCNKYDYNKHLSTRKHLNGNDNGNNGNEKSLYTCGNCNNTYKYNSGLCRHKRTCTTTVVVSQPIISPTIPAIIDPMVCPPAVENQIFERLVNEIIKSNQETQRQNEALQKQVLELCKNGTHNTTHTNSHNKTFNLSVFLNEDCKNAINFKDFVESIEVSREDLTNTGQLGFVGGISKILMDHLKELGIHERPIHCTDLKRETVYIKENNEWNKETDDTKMRSAIQEVSRKSMGTLIDWKKNNPEYANVNSQFSNECINMQRNSIAGYDRDTLYPRVVRELNKIIALKDLKTP
jgi:hypothetical protein